MSLRDHYSHSPESLPPGPRGLPFLGNALDLKLDPLGFMVRLASHEPIAVCRVGPVRGYFINDPALVRDVLVTKSASFRQGRGVELARTLFGEGLFSSEGAFHRRQRLLSQPSFHRDRLASYAAIVLAKSAQMQSRWCDGGVVDIAKQAAQLTLGVVTQTLFSSDVDAQAVAIGEALGQVLRVLQARLTLPEFLERLPLPMNRRFAEAKRTLDGIVYDIIARRRAAPAHHDDLLSTLMLARDDEAAEPTAGGQMSDLQLRDEVMTLIMAGHETTATLLTWTWSLLAQNPSAEAQVLAEIDALGGHPPTFEDLPRLRCLNQALSESLRLYPPAWAISKYTVDDWQAGPYLIPKGSLVVLCPYTMHRHPRYFPEPDRFRLDRWTPEEEARRPKLCYFPFGGGPRICIGEGFAMMEAALVIASIGVRWRLRLAPGHVPRPETVFTLRPSGGMPMRVEHR